MEEVGAPKTGSRVGVTAAGDGVHDEAVSSKNPETTSAMTRRMVGDYSGAVFRLRLAPGATPDRILWGTS
jgi:hypothetical protein